MGVANSFARITNRTQGTDNGGGVPEPLAVCKSEDSLFQNQFGR